MWLGERQAFTPAPASGQDTYIPKLHVVTVTSQTRYITLPGKAVGTILALVDGAQQVQTTLGADGITADFGAGNLSAGMVVAIFYLG